MNYESIGKFIKEKRTNLGLTQKELAKKLNITDKAISKWERGLSLPDISLLEDLSRILNCSISEILNGGNVDINKLDDYTKNTIEYGKNNIIKNINSIIIFVVLITIGYIGICNINSIYKVHKVYDNYHFNYETLEQQENALLKNISIIKNNQGKYSEGHYEFIIDGLNKLEKGINDNILLSYKGKKGYSNLDMLMLHYTTMKKGYFNFISFLTDYYKVDYKKYADYIRFYMNANIVEDEDYFNYYYKYNLFKNNFNDYGPMPETIGNQLELVYSYKLLTEIIMEAGDIHE